MSEGYFPAEFSLSDGPITAVQTSPNDPRVRLDSTGVFATDANGKKTTTLDSNAQGFELLAGTGSTPPNARKIRWLTDDTGALIAEYSAYTDATDNPANLTIAAHGRNDAVSRALIGVRDDTSGKQGGFYGEITPSAGGGSWARAYTTNQGRVIVDDSGYSDFPQVIAQNKLIGAQSQNVVVNLPGPGGYLVHQSVHGPNREAACIALIDVPTAQNLTYMFAMEFHRNYANLGADCYPSDPWGATGGTDYQAQAGSRGYAITCGFATNGVACELRYTIVRFSAQPS